VGIFPWSSDVISKTKQLLSAVRKKEIPKLYSSPWVPVGVLGVDPQGSK